MLKDERHSKNKQLYVSLQESLKEKYPEQEKIIAEIYHDLQSEDMREMILNEGKRIDGRSPADIRPITCEVECFRGTTARHYSQEVKLKA